MSEFCQEHRFQARRPSRSRPDANVGCRNCGQHWQKHSYFGMKCPLSSKTLEVED